MTNLTNTEGYFVRINYDDGDVRDSLYTATGRRIRAEGRCLTEAMEASKGLRAEVDACKGATVLATFRAGKRES